MGSAVHCKNCGVELRLIINLRGKERWQHVDGNERCWLVATPDRGWDPGA